MQPQTFTLIVTGMGISGTLGGIVIGHFLTRSWQREQWLLDRRREEWRELQTALAHSLKVALRYTGGMIIPGQDVQRDVINPQEETFRVFRDRVFIAADLKAMAIERRWSDAIQAHYQNADRDALTQVYDQLRAKIVEWAIRG